nr:hypothetical protein [Tanacetum cinerariifolium]
AGCKDTFKSTSGGAQFLGEKLVSWSSMKQDCTALSTAEAEYVSLSACCAQLDYQLAVIFTKALTAYCFNYLVHRLGMRNLSPKELERLAESHLENQSWPLIKSCASLDYHLGLSFCSKMVGFLAWHLMEVVEKVVDLYPGGFKAKYTLEILHKHGMDKGQSIGTPMATKPKLDADLSGNPVDQTDYRSKIGPLMYLTSSRPDIVQAACFCARYQSRPTKKHIKEVKRIFRNLRGDKLVSWMSKKQNCTAMSSAEAEYVALSASCAQVIIEYQLVDMFTKALPEDRFKYLIRRIGMRCLNPAEMEVLAKESA